MLYPLTFEPIFQERVWGGRRLETIFNKPLPKIYQLVRMCFCRFHGQRIMRIPMKNASHKWFGLDAALSRD